MEITLPGRPFRYGNVVFRQPFRGSTHKLTVTDETITLAWAYNPEFGQKGYVAAIRLIRRGGSLKAFEKGISLTGEDSLTVVSSIVKFEHDFSFACAQKVQDELMALPVDFDRMLAANRKIIGEKMDRCFLTDADRTISGIPQQSQRELILRRLFCIIRSRKNSPGTSIRREQER